MELMSIVAVANFFGKTRQAIDNWLNSGVLPRERLTIKIGRSVFFIKSELEKFLLEQRQLA